VLRGHPGLAARLLECQSRHPVRGIAGQGIRRGGLPIGGDEPLQFAPELVHRVQFRSLLGQPEQPDAERRGQHLGARGGMRAGPVGEQPDRAGGAVAASQLAQECLGIDGAGTWTDEHDPVRSPQVDRTEQHPLGVGTGDRHRGLCAFPGPGRAQGRKQPQQRPVAAQQRVAGAPTSAETSNYSPFFWARCTARPA
jgi:hypothetical protein